MSKKCTQDLEEFEKISSMNQDVQIYNTPSEFLRKYSSNMVMNIYNSTSQYFPTELLIFTFHKSLGEF